MPEPIDWDRKLSEVQFFVEATSCEQHYLWREYQFEQESIGFVHQVGTLDKRPVNITFVFITLNGFRIAFWEAVSQVVDYAMIEKWFDDNYCPKWDSGTRPARCDAMNFHLAVGASKERADAH